MTKPTTDQIEETYRAMAEAARYRPMAPSDGLGNISRPLEELDLSKEAAGYVRYWLDQEDSREYWVGVPDWRGRPALIYAIEAARNICGMAPHVAERLLRLALAEIEEGKVGSIP